MTAYGFNIFIFYVSLILYPSHGFDVIQPHNRTVNSDGSVSISCEHTANGNSVIDVRLNGISLTDKKKSLLCQKEMKLQECKNSVMHQENPNKYLFIIFNIGPEAMNMTYQCEFTVKRNDIDETKKGTPTTLLPGGKEAACVPQPPPPFLLPPPPPQSHELRWILIGLLALMSLYSCVITSLYIGLRFSNRGPENSTYVVMRKAPMPRNPAFDIYCG